MKNRENGQKKKQWSDTKRVRMMLRTYADENSQNGEWNI